MLLLPRRYKIAGCCLFFLGIVSAVSRFYYGVKPEIFDFRVWAVYSSFLETKYFSFISNNISEEVTSILLLTGLMLTACSKEKIETPKVQFYRFKALVAALIINYSILLLAVILVFGLGFMEILVINMFSPLIIYLLVLNYYMIKNKDAIRDPENNNIT